MFKLIKDFNQSGVKIAKGEYTKEQLVFFFGSIDKFNFCYNCTNLKEILKEEILEEPTEEVVEEVVEEKEVKEKTTKELKDNKKNTKNKK